MDKKTIMLEIQKQRNSLFYSLLSLPATAMGFALSVQIAALSWLLSTKYGLEIYEVGFVWLAGPLAGMIGQVAVGIVSDRVWFLGGRRRPFILIGGTLAALMLLLLPHLDSVGNALGISNLMIVALMVALTLDLAINISFNPTRSIIADVTPEGDERTKGYTWMQTISGSFGVLAYFLGALWGNYFLIYFSVFLVLAFSLIPPFFIEEPKVLQADSNARVAANKLPAENQAELNKIYIAHAFTWLGVQTMFVYIFAYISQKIAPGSDEATGKIIAYAFLVMNMVGFLLPVMVLEPLAKQVGRVKVHTLCIGIMALAYLVILLVGKSALSLYLQMIFVGIGWAATVSLPFAIFSEKVDQERMGYYMGIFNLSVVIPQIIVSGIFGLLINWIPDKNFIFVICTVSLAISAYLWTKVEE